MGPSSFIELHRPKWFVADMFGPLKPGFVLELMLFKAHQVFFLASTLLQIGQEQFYSSIYIN